MATKKGRNYEHDLTNLVGDATDGELVPLAAGYNSDLSRDVDMLIDDGEAVHVFELKKTSKDAYTLHWDEDDRQKDDLYGLIRFCVEYPRPTYPYVGVRFDNRQLALTKTYVGHWPDQEQLLRVASELSPIESKVTRAGNLRFYKPPSSEWTTQSLDQHDAQHVLDTIGYVY